MSSPPDATGAPTSPQADPLRAALAEVQAHEFAATKALERRDGWNRTMKELDDRKEAVARRGGSWAQFIPKIRAAGAEAVKAGREALDEKILAGAAGKKAGTVQRGVDAGAAIDDAIRLRPELASMTPDQRKAIVDSASRGTGDVVTDVSTQIDRAFPRESEGSATHRRKVAAGILHVATIAAERGAAPTPEQVAQAEKLLDAGGSPEDVAASIFGAETPEDQGRKAARKTVAEAEELRKRGFVTKGKTVAEAAASIAKMDAKSAGAERERVISDKEQDFASAQRLLETMISQGIRGDKLKPYQDTFEEARKEMDRARALRGGGAAEASADPRAAARAEYDALPDDQKTPENARKIAAKHGVK